MIYLLWTTLSHLSIKLFELSSQQIKVKGKIVDLPAVDHPLSLADKTIKILKSANKGKGKIVDLPAVDPPLSLAAKTIKDF